MSSKPKKKTFNNSDKKNTTLSVKPKVIEEKPLPKVEIPKPEYKPIVKPVPIPEHKDSLIRKIHGHFTGNQNYKKPMTLWLISRYCMIHAETEELIEKKVIELMQIVMAHYKDILEFDFNGKKAYCLDSNFAFLDRS